VSGCLDSFAGSSSVFARFFAYFFGIMLYFAVQQIWSLAFNLTKTMCDLLLKDICCFSALLVQR